jgi:DNA-directed RNA polymerase subunit K/omega
MELENETENIEKYYNTDEDEGEGEGDNYSESSDSEFSESEPDKPTIKIGDAIYDDEAEGNKDGEMEDSEAESEVGSEEDENNDSESEFEIEVSKKEPKKITKKVAQKMSSDDDDNASSDEEEDGEDYLQKFDREINDNYILRFHPECKSHNYDEISALTKVVYNEDNIIVDPLHRTIPILTKYEKTRVLGQRAKQINSGGKPFVKVPENIIDGYLIAEMELAQKRIPFIIRRPLPSGGSEYWNLSDLELID